MSQQKHKPDKHNMSVHSMHKFYYVSFLTPDLFVECVSDFALLVIKFFNSALN